MRPIHKVGQLWCPKCHRNDKLKVGYSWWCDRCQIGGTQHEIRQALERERKRHESS